MDWVLATGSYEYDVSVLVGNRHVLCSVGKNCGSTFDQHGFAPSSLTCLPPPVDLNEPEADKYAWLVALTAKVGM